MGNYICPRCDKTNLVKDERAGGYVCYTKDCGFSISEDDSRKPDRLLRIFTEEWLRAEEGVDERD
jgi:transcription initiation factor TFIIIB Brf1 subunit/transcription initiation factor TFIIB